MLFFKECKKVLFSLTFLLYTAAVLAMYFSQFDGDLREPLVPPVEGYDNYGTVAKEVPEILMPAAIDGLVGEYLSGSFTAYPIGFYKSVRLNEKKKDQLCDIIYELSGITRQELDNFTDYEAGGMEMIPDGNGGYTVLPKEMVLPQVNIPETLTYERFRELMRQADKIIGGGSDYSDAYIVPRFSRVPKTYEEALAEYNETIYNEKITPAYARLFCDYSGIVLAILPVFVAASLTGRDKKSQMEQLIFSRRVSSLKLVFVRFTALITVMLIPLALTVALAQIKVIGFYPGYEIDIFALPKYAARWLVPNIMLATAVGMLFTELFSSLLSIFIQGAWWFMSIFASSEGLTGKIKSFTLVLRHNSLYGADLFADTLRQFTFNRIFYTMLAVMLVILTVIIYEAKRRGGYIGLSKISKNNNNKSAA